MGMFGKYLLELHFTNGEHGYFLDIYDGGIMLTENPDAAQRFMTMQAARNYYNRICDLPSAYDYGAYIEYCDVMRCRNY